MGLIEEVRGFISGLRREAPELFRRPPKPPRGAGVPDEIKSRVERWSALIGVGYGTIRVKDQRTLWGSCSAKGNLNFNRRLLHCPPEILDYVVIHELAHRRELNHSRRFWAIVETYCPRHRECRLWLRRHGPELLNRRRRPELLN